ALAALQRAHEAVGELSAHLAVLAAPTGGEADALVDRLASAFLTRLAALSAVGIFASVLVTVLLPPLIRRPVVAISETVHRVAQGDLSVPPLEVKMRDELGRVAEAVNAMVLSMREMAAQLVQSGNELLLR